MSALDRARDVISDALYAHRDTHRVDLPEAILAALVEEMELREQPIRAEWPHMAHDKATRLVTDWVEEE